MADDVPVTDILCDVMEYLSKLGANLRTRSENLKEKRIRKDRLKNSHAIHKAAQKVLTICELSRKSLDNVEVGVKRILSVVDAAQATGDGGKSEKRNRIESGSISSSSNRPSLESRKKENLSSPKSIHVSGKKYVLRFPRKVNVKHYQSVKVLARSMPKSMLKKYPVYYNCKLYRARERKAQKEEIVSSENRISVDNKEIESEIIIDEETEDTLNKETERKMSKDSDDECEETVSTPVKDHNKNSPELEDIKVKDVQSKGNTESEFTKIKHESKQSTKDSSDVESSSKLHKSPKDEEKKERKKHKADKSKVNSEEESLKHKKKKKHRRIIVDSSDSDQEVNNKKPSEGNGEVSNIALCEERESTNPVEKLCLTEIRSNESSKDKHEFTGNDESEKEILASTKEKSDDESSEDKHIGTSKEKSNEVPSEIKLVEDASKERPSDETSRENITEKEDTKPNPENGSKVDENKQRTEPVKPMIKCVSLNKLLKPDILEKKEKVNDEPKTMVVHMNKKGELRTKFIDPVKISKKSHEEELKLAKRRKQLAEFKPKNFFIKVMKLPTLSVEFLHENNLKKITQNGSIVCEISTDTLDSESNLDKIVSSEKYVNDALPSPCLTDTNYLNEAKNALLNDSDGEKSKTLQKNSKKKVEDALSEVINETEKIKNSLLKDSDSDKNDEDNIKKLPENENKSSEDKPLNAQQTDNTPSESFPNKDAQESHVNMQENKVGSPEKVLADDEQDKELAKSLLLNDSSGSSSKSPEKKRKKDSSGIKSRRKHMMESMHAKKMLLTYSSSSDTEDEQLKNAMKNIKDNLLKDIEDDSKKSQKKKLLSTSESDEDILKNVKKKRKVVKSRSPSPVVTAEKDEEEKDDEEKVDEAKGEEKKNDETEKDKESASNNSHSDCTSEKSKSSRSKVRS